jgi:hypothetical protein
LAERGGSSNPHRPHDTQSPEHPGKVSAAASLFVQERGLWVVFFVGCAAAVMGLLLLAFRLLRPIQ